MKHIIFRHIETVLSFLPFFIVVGILSLFMYIFYSPIIDLFGFLFENPIYNFLQINPVWMYLVILFIFLSLFSITVFSSLIVYYSIQRNYRNTSIDRYSKFYSYVLTNYFMSDFYKVRENRDRLLKRIKPFTKTRLRLFALLDTYLKIQDTLEINLNQDFKYLINKLNLLNRIKSYVRYRKFDMSVLAMRVLSYLRDHSCEKQILKNAESSNYALRTEAYAALIRLMEKDEHLINFIGEKHNLSLLDMNVIVNTVISNNKIKINYRELLASENEEKILIGLMLAKYRYRENKRNLTLILNLLDNPNPIFNHEAWNALITLIPKEDASDFIISRFNDEPDNIKLLILQKSERFKDQKYIDFIINNLEHQSLLVKVEALKLLFNTDYNLLLNYTDTKNEELKVACNEVSCMYMW